MMGSYLRNCFSKLQLDKRLRHKPKKCFKDVVKNNLQVLRVEVGFFDHYTMRIPASCRAWKPEEDGKLINIRIWIYDDCKTFEIRRIEHEPRLVYCWTMMVIVHITLSDPMLAFAKSPGTYAR